jgi:hypothetical protein
VKTTEYQIKNQSNKDLVISEINALPHGDWTIKIYNGCERKTTAQNRLLWKWYTEIGEHFGMESEEMHLFAKEKFLLSILYRDDPGFAMMADAVKRVKAASKDDYHFIRNQVISLTSTRGLYSKQMTEYLDKVKRFAMENNVEITIPPDKELKWLCGIK